MISLHFLDDQNQIVLEFASSDALSPLLTSNGLDLPTILPQPNLIVQEWNPDSVINALQSISERVTPHAITEQGALTQKPVALLSEAEKAAIAGQTHRDYTLNDEAYVEYMAPVVVSASPAPDGLDDLDTLLDMLKRARNQGLSLETITFS